MFATVQLRVIGCPEKSSAGACTLVTSSSGGGLSVTSKPALIAILSVRLSSCMAKWWCKPVPSGTT
jgi:hypothetical protein